MSNTRFSGSPSFGPYNSQAEALFYCQRFMNLGFSPEDASSMGIIWAGPTGMVVLRPPAVDQESQIGASLLVQSHGPVKPVQPEPPSGGTWQSIADAVASAYRTAGQRIHQGSRHLDEVDSFIRRNTGIFAPGIESASGIDKMLAARAGWRYLEKELHEHETAAAIASTVLDVVGVVVGGIAVFALLPEIAAAAGSAAIAGAVAATAGAATATVASGLLMTADGRESYLLLKGDEAAVDDWRNTPFFKQTELIAPLLALPDALRSGVGAAREIGAAEDAARAADEALATAAARSDQASGRVAAQQASNEAKERIYKGDRAKLQKAISAQKRAATKLNRANKLVEAKRQAVMAAMLKSLKREGPGLGSAVMGTGNYVEHLPDLMKRYTPSITQPTTPAQALLPQSCSYGASGRLDYLSFGIIASSPLKG